MNKEQTGAMAAQSAIDEVLRQMLAWAQDAGAFAQSELPHVAREVLMWGGVSNAVYAVISLSLAAALIYYAVKWWPRMVQNAAEPAVFLMGLMAPLATCFGITCILDAIKVIVAPRLYLIEWLTSRLS